MINQIIMDILRRKIHAGEIKIEDVKRQEYKDALSAQ